MTKSERPLLLFAIVGLVATGYSVWRLLTPIKKCDEKTSKSKGLTLKLKRPLTNYRKILTATRIHTSNASSLPPISKVLTFITNALQYSDKVMICISSSFLSEEELTKYTTEIKSQIFDVMSDSVIFLTVTPWGHFTTALNAALLSAQDHRIDFVFFQSLELQIDSDAANKMKKKIESDKHILVVGTEISGHDFNEGLHPVRGRTCPWNTAAIWNVQLLSITGFPMIGDGTADRREIGGVEEVSAVNLLQYLYPYLRAILVRFEGQKTSWDTEFAGDLKRFAYHETKMQSKDERPSAQMDVSGLPPGVVEHMLL